MTVVHFTRLRNLQSIISEGLTPRALLNGDVVPFNDAYRYDGYPDANCMSISFPNYQMFYRYRKNSDEGWIVLVLDACLLWEMDCAFCIENAASRAVRSILIDQRKSLSALQKMFGDYTFKSRTLTRQELGIPASYPTHPQAEVLVFNTISVKYFRAVHFENDKDLRECKGMLSCIPSLNVYSISNFFRPRIDWRIWKEVQSSTVINLDELMRGLSGG